MLHGFSPMRCQISSFRIASLFLAMPYLAMAEQIPIVDAQCAKDQARICFRFLNADGSANMRHDCVNYENSINEKKISAKARKMRKKGFAEAYPLGCGEPQMALARSVTDCTEYARTVDACIRKVEVMTPADIKTARDDFTAQLDAWLKILEKSGAVNLEDPIGDDAGSSGAAPPKN